MLSIQIEGVCHDQCVYSLAQPDCDFHTSYITFNFYMLAELKNKTGGMKDCLVTGVTTVPYQYHPFQLRNQ